MPVNFAAQELFVHNAQLRGQFLEDFLGSVFLFDSCFEKHYWVSMMPSQIASFKQYRIDQFSWESVSYGFLNLFCVFSRVCKRSYVDVGYWNLRRQAVPRGEISVELTFSFSLGLRSGFSAHQENFQDFDVFLVGRPPFQVQANAEFQSLLWV
jgi:hypothetical protein